MLSRLFGVLLPFFVSFLIAYILDPIVGFIQNKCRVKNRVLSVLITLVLVAGVLSTTVVMLRQPIIDQVNMAWQGMQKYLTDFNLNDYLSPEVQEQLRAYTADWDIEALLAKPEITETIKDGLAVVGDWITGGISVISKLLVFFIGFLYLLFLLIEFPTLRANWSNYVPRKYRTQVVSVVGEIDRNMNAYFRGQALVATCVGILFAIGFSIIGLPMGLAMGLIVGALNFVPYMQGLGIPPCILLCLLQSAQTGQPVWLTLLLMAIVFIVVQSIQDMILVPKIMGNVTGLGPTVILLSLSIWGALLGVIGMIIALPLTTILITYYKRYITKKGVSSRKNQAVYRGRLRRV